MIRYLRSLGLVVGLFLFVVVGYVDYAYSHEEHELIIPEEVSKPTLSPESPRVIVIGNSSEAPQHFMEKLPTGYIWEPNKEVEVELNIDTSNFEDPRALFLIDDAGKTNVDEILRWAQEVGKREVYLAYRGKYNPEYPIVEFSPSLEDLIHKARDIIDYSWTEYFRDIFIVQEAHANNVTVGPGCGHILQWNIPAGACTTHTLSDDNSGDGRTPSIKICMMYCSLLHHHYNPMQTHVKRNMAGYQSGNVRSHVDCLKNIHGNGWIKNPVNLTVELHVDQQAVGDAVCAHLGNFPGCNQDAIGRAELGPKTTPRKTYDLRMWIAEDWERNRWSVSRHEIMHSYGYNDMETGADVDSIDTCRASQYRFF